MGQKTDARIFRLGLKKNNWDLKYTEKTKEESSFYLYSGLQIQKYLNRFFNLHGLSLHVCKIHYSSDLLQIFVSYFVTEKSMHYINKIHLNQNLSIKDKKIRKSKMFAYKRLKIIKKIKLTLSNKQFQGRQNLQNNSFGEILLESLNIFVKKNVNIILTLQNINANFHYYLEHNNNKNFKNVLLQLRRFVKNKFFKEAINVLFITIKTRNSSKLLAEFISNQMKINQLRTNQSRVKKRDNYFIGFMKQALTIFVNSEMSLINGVKIIINGRINGAPRARSITLKIGNLPLQSLNAKINYHCSTAYSTNGTFGVKVWICEN